MIVLVTLQCYFYIGENMVKAYDNFYLSFIQRKMGEMFEVAVFHEKLSLEAFCELFLKSKVCHYFEIADHEYVLGRSSLELLADILNKDPEEIMLNAFATPEYWSGYALAYVQWFFNKPFSYVLEHLEINCLYNMYFPYHEMDLQHLVDAVKSKMDLVNKLTDYRKSKGYTQKDLSIVSGVPLRTIRGYEQGTLSIEKAQADTLYAISKVLGCTIEDLIS